MKTSTSGSSNGWLTEMKRKRDVLKLRREALDIARKIIEDDPRFSDMSPYEIELAACDLCDRQIKEVQFTKGEQACQ